MVPVPESVRRDLQDRLERHARTAWSERCARVEVRFRGEYAYVDAFESDPWVRPDVREEGKERIRQTPTKLCRLTWISDPDPWVFAFYKYSDERYEPSITLDGSFEGSPETCFDTAAQAYLR
jgi:hypothetical protein